MNNMNFMGFDRSYEEAQVVLFGAPFDGTTSFRPGTRFGPQATRPDSYGLETYSPFMQRDLEEYLLCDHGDLEFPFGNTERVLEMIYDQTKKIVDDNKVPLMIGGEHLVTFPAAKAVIEKYPELVFLHFDAHADLRTDYMGQRHSHATVMNLVHEMVGDDRIYQFGIRSGTKEEFAFAKDSTIMEKYTVKTVQKIVEKIIDCPVYVTIDLDVLDPSIFSGTGTPEPGGIDFMALQTAIYALRSLNIVGADVVELSPHYDQTGVSNAVACKVIRELTLAIF